MISAFTISKNVESQSYPYIESIMSFLPVVDELIVVDSSTDGSTKKIQELSDKIRIVKEPWEDNWYYWRMNHNFDRGFTECKGDVVIKFDLDRVLHEDSIELLKHDCEKMLHDNCLTMIDSAYSIPVVNKINKNKNQILATNMRLARKLKLNLRFGVDLEYGFHNNMVEYLHHFNNLIYGKRNYRKTMETGAKIFNYGHCFMTKGQARHLFFRIWNAPLLQRNEPPKSYKSTTEIYINSRKNSAERTEKFDEISLDFHPEIIQKRILNMKPNQKGFNLWGSLPTPSFLEAK